MCLLTVVEQEKRRVKRCVSHIWHKRKQMEKLSWVLKRSKGTNN